MILDEIIAHKKAEVEDFRSSQPLSMLIDTIERGPKARDFIDALVRTQPVGIIAEIKYKSPSAGVIRPDFDPAAIAAQYRTAGAAAISVLTDARFFGGSFDFLRQIRAATDIPLLCKDFMISSYQLYQARAHGADCILLIVAALTDDTLARLYELARELGMAALVEVHNESELTRALKLQPTLIGINNRNLKTFVTTLETSVQLAKLLPSDVLRVAESGIRSGQDIVRLRGHGFSNFLVGEHLMRAESPGAMLAELIAEGSR